MVERGGGGRKGGASTYTERRDRREHHGLVPALEKPGIKHNCYRDMDMETKR